MDVPGPDEFELTPFVPPVDEDAQPDLFGAVAQELTLADVKRAIRGVSRPRDLRPLVQKSSHDPLLNMLELAMKAKEKGEDTTAFDRFKECLPYIWTRVSAQGMAAMLGEGAPGSAGEMIVRWANPVEDGQ